MVYIIMRLSFVLAVFRDADEAKEYIHLIKQLSEAYHREYYQMQHYPAKDLQKLLQEHLPGMIKLISKHLPTYLPEDGVRQVAEMLLDEAALDSDEQYDILEVPLSNFHLQEKRNLELSFNNKKRLVKNAGILNE